jgi:hypothetical protein
METATINLKAIDAEHDIVPRAVVVPDYNGDPIVHVFVTGERVLRMAPLEDWNFEFTPCSTTQERQAYASLAYHLGELNEDQDQELANAWGDFQGRSEVAVFDEVTSHIDGHLMVAWAGTVADAVWAEEGNLSAWFSIDGPPTGW